MNMFFKVHAVHARALTKQGISIIVELESFEVVSFRLSLRSLSLNYGRPSFNKSDIFFFIAVNLIAEVMGLNPVQA